MSDVLKKLKNYPDVSFIDDVSFAELQEQMIKDYEKQYRELTGKTVSLAPADPYRLILYSCAVAIYQGYQYEDRAGKMGLLKYSTGKYLENIAAAKGITRNPATAALTTIRFTLSMALSKDAVIPKGTRIKGSAMYFETTETKAISAGAVSVDIPAQCQIAGTEGNGYLAGDIRVLVDPLPYTLSAQNVETTAGGTNEESDEELVQRIYLAPSSYSTAGPAAAYEYWVKSYSTAIGECKVTSESPGEVDIYITVNGEPPEDGYLEELEKYLTQKNVRPLTDHVVVKKPETVKYDIDAVYYIQGTERGMEDAIKAAAEAACENYVLWQKKIGRDITPSRLIFELMQAGVHSVEITSPVYTELSTSQMAAIKAVNLICGGFRDD